MSVRGMPSKLAGGLRQAPKVTARQRLAQRLHLLERTVAQQAQILEALQGRLSGVGLELDTAQLAFLRWMDFTGEHWAALRDEALQLRTAGLAAHVMFRGMGEAFGHLIATEEAAPAPGAAA